MAEVALVTLLPLAKLLCVYCTRSLVLRGGRGLRGSVKMECRVKNQAKNPGKISNTYALNEKYTGR